MSILARLAALGPRFEPELGPMRTPTTVQEETQYIRQFVEDRQQVEDTGAADDADRFNADAINYDLGDGIDLKDEEVLLSEEQEKYETGRQTYTRNGRNYLLIIYSDGTSEEQDLGPADQPQAPPEPPATTVVPGEPVEEFDARAFAQTNYPWLGNDLIDTFLQEFNTNGGDEDEALRVLRTTQAYKDKFPGIFREDGTTLRIDTTTPELDYIKIKEDYTNLLSDYNLNPDYFEGQITTLFQNDVAPRVFEQRLNVAYNSLFGQFDAVKEYYVANYPNIFPTTEDISDEAIFASFISEDVSADIINRRIQVSQIGGAFREQDFAISTEQAQRLISAGVTGQGAQQLAARAEVQLPRLQRLAQRFTGREDIFGLSEFIESEVFGSGVADQVRARLEAEQQTAFTREGGAAVTQAGVTGLVEA